MISVGVDIGTFSIKIADVEATSKSYVIRRVQEIPLSLDPNKDRKIQIIDALRTLFSQYDLEQSQFIFGLPQKQVSERLLTLPFRERFKVQKAMVAMLEDELPFSTEDSVFEAKIVRFNGKGADVLAMAAPRERVTELLDLAHDCGVEPALISCEGIGIHNLFERWYEPPVEALPALQDTPAARTADLVINIGHLSSELLVISDGALLGVHNIDWGGKNIADAIAVKYGLNYMAAVRELQSKGFILLEKAQGSREQVAFSQVIEGALMVLVSELRVKMLELESDLHLQWTKGHLLGGGGQLKNLNGFFTQQFQIPFNRYKQFEHHPPVSFEFSSHLEMVTGAAVGLAIEGLRRPRNPATNFLKGDLVKQANVMAAVWEKWGYAAKIAGAAFVLFFIYAVIRDSLALRLLDESDKALKTQAQAVAKIPARQASASRIRKFISSAQAMEKGRMQAEKVLRLNSALDVMEVISASLPPKMATKFEVKRLSIRGDDAEVHGHTLSDFDIQSIAKALKKAAVGGKVDAVQAAGNVPIPSGRIPFGFKFKVARTAGAGS